MLKQYIRKADIILFIVLVVIGLAASAALSFSRSDASAGAKVIIESGGHRIILGSEAAAAIRVEY